MHTLMILASFALALAGCLVCMGLLHRARSSSSRRAVQLVGLILPIIMLGTLATLMVHFVSQVCFQTAPPIDIALAQALSLIGALGIIVAFLINIVRAVLLPVHLRRHTWEAPSWLQSMVGELAQETGLRRTPQALVSADDKPWALVTGLFRPRLAISGGLVMLLDEEELGAVLRHELQHIRRGDLWWTALCGVMSDLSWFLPVTRRLYGQMLTEQEVACDDRVVGEPNRLALASALARIWQAGVGKGPRSYLASGGSLALFSPRQEAHYEARVHRLIHQEGTSNDPVSVPLAGSGRAVRPFHTLRESSSSRALLAATLMLGLFVPAQLAIALFAMEQMGCGIQHWPGTITTMMP